MSKRKTVGIVGLRIGELRGDPQETLMGNPVRSWALFENLPEFGFDTELFVDRHAPIALQLENEYGARFVRDSGEFRQKAAGGHYDAVVVCGTRIHLSLEHHPWLGELSGCPVFLGQCYHNVDTPLPEPLVEAIVGATFVTPRYQQRWSIQHPSSLTGVMTQGQIPHPPKSDVSNGDAVFVGHIHTHGIIKRLALVAASDPARNYHIISSRIRRPGGQSGEYVVMGDIESDCDRQAQFDSIMKQIGAERPSNMYYHFLPPGHEGPILNSSSVGLDFSWNPSWSIDNSKVPYYLSYGLKVVCQLPAPSYRFLYKFGAGEVLPYDASEEQWQNAIDKAGNNPVEQKNALRAAAGQAFSWRNATFDLASIMFEYFDQKASNRGG
jgi:hypothetical protein